MDLSVDARAVYDAVAATDTCEPAESSLKLHLLSVRNRMETRVIRKLHWVDTRDMLADGLTKGGIDRELLHNVSNDCRFSLKHEALTHSKSPTPAAGSATNKASEEDSGGGLESRPEDLTDRPGIE